ncbi:MAG: Hsp70 family protein, partial [Synechococcales cyanobacterium RU_4_20]|nr:Hsp70 family protein [Synechococcales cyanobacterium RU_4_20]
VMKPLIPRNTSVPVRKSDIFSTGENNQTLVEIHVLQGERKMAAGNKSLGRFKLMGIPPAPRGVPQVQVSFDIDSNGILQVSALDRTTGREQTVTIQGASTLSDTEVDRMIQEAEDYAQEDSQKKAKIDRRNQVESLASRAERKLREVAIDFGMYFADRERRQVESYIRELKQALEEQDERAIDLIQADLQDALKILEQEIKLRLREEEGDDLFKSVKDTFADIKDSIIGEDSYRPPRDDYYERPGDRYGSGGYGSGGYGSGGYGQGSYRDARSSGNRPNDGLRPSPQDRTLPTRNPYPREDFGDDDDW